MQGTYLFYNDYNQRAEQHIVQKEYEDFKRKWDVAITKCQCEEYCVEKCSNERTSLPHARAQSGPWR